MGAFYIHISGAKKVNVVVCFRNLDLKREYPEDISTTFNIYSEPSWNEKSSKLLLTAPDCIITAVSGLTLDSASQNQITEFTVTWRCPRFFTD